MTEQNHEQKPRENSEPNTRKSRINRRTFLGTGIAAATATLIILYRAIARLTSSKFPAPQPYRYTNFRDPIEFTGKELRVAEHQLTLPGNDGNEGVPNEPGLPDQFHYFQPRLLRQTFSRRGGSSS